MASDVNAMKRPSVLLITGSALAPFPAVPLPSTDTRSVLGWTANSTEPIAVFPVLSVTVNVAVKFPATVGVPLTTPVPGSRRKSVGGEPVGKPPPKSVQVNGAVPPVAARVAV